MVQACSVRCVLRCKSNAPALLTDQCVNGQGDCHPATAPRSSHVASQDLATNRTPQQDWRSPVRMGCRGLIHGPTASKGSGLTISRSDTDGDLGEPLISAKQGSVKRSGRLRMSSTLAMVLCWILLWFQARQFCSSIHLSKHPASSLVQVIGLWIYPVPCWRARLSSGPPHRQHAELNVPLAVPQGPPGLLQTPCPGQLGLPHSK